MMVPPLCYMDQDGVLADFVTGAVAYHGGDIKYIDVRWDIEEQLGLTKADFWNPLGRHFWEGLPPTPECFDVVRLVEKYFVKKQAAIATSPCMTKGCGAGKSLWVDTWLPDYSRRLHLVENKAVLAGTDRYLIDDRNENCDEWEAAGGRAFLFPRPWNRNAEYVGTDVVAMLDQWLRQWLGR